MISSSTAASGVATGRAAASAAWISSLGSCCGSTAATVVLLPLLPLPIAIGCSAGAARMLFKIITPPTTAAMNAIAPTTASPPRRRCGVAGTWPGGVYCCACPGAAIGALGDSGIGPLGWSCGTGDTRSGAGSGRLGYALAGRWRGPPGRPGAVSWRSGRPGAVLGENRTSAAAGSASPENVGTWPPISAALKSGPSGGAAAVSASSPQISVASAISSFERWSRAFALGRRIAVARLGRRRATRLAT